MNEGFFDNQRDQSRVKSEIVALYFDVWSNILQGALDHIPKADKRLGYVDLFSGPGVYDDGSPSTPLKVLHHTLADGSKRRNLVTVFNDHKKKYADRLSSEIDCLPGIETLTHRPIVLRLDAGEAMIHARARVKHVPTLYFIDPIGYKGVTLEMLKEAIHDWGSEFILFFNYNRINQAVTIEQVAEHIDAFFGPERAEKMRAEILGRDARERELYVTEQATEALLDAGARYVLPFRFKKADGSRTSHYLVFASKGFKGYDEMKRIMARLCASDPDGVPTFEYCEADGKYPQLFGYTLSVSDLVLSILTDYAGRTVTLDEMYADHSAGRPFIRANYVTALQQLEGSDSISVTRPPRARSGAYGPKTTITLPSKDQA